jgi:hypothetical protein
MGADAFRAAHRAEELRNSDDDAGLKASGDTLMTSKIWTIPATGAAFAYVLAIVLL